MRPPTRLNWVQTMGAWGYKTFENDIAADWLDDLVESESVDLVHKPLHAVDKLKGNADRIDCEEALAAADVLAGARHDPPAKLPAKARRWAVRVGFTPNKKDNNLALKVVKQIAKDSELLDSWRESSKAERWLKETEKTVRQLEMALHLPTPRRMPKPKRKQKTIAEIMMEISPEKQSDRRKALQTKLKRLKNPHRNVGGKGLSALTPLHWAALRGLVPEAEILITKGADVNARDGLMAGPVYFAVKHNQKGILKVLIAAGGDLDYAISSAISCDRLAILRWLTTIGVNLAKHLNPIHGAATAGATRVLAELIKRGLSANAKDEYGDTPLHAAAMYGHKAVVRMLIAAGADPNVVNLEGNSPLHEAVACNYTAIARMLLTAGAERDIVNLEGKSPADLAAEYGNKKIEKLLFE